jgi:CDP-diacylglycerol--serine O-phosphatidyltransferase
MGLTSIQYGFRADFESAILLILLSCILDGLDGRVARLLGCQSKFGAELDSLADVVNFGVAPALIIYLWTFQEIPEFGWMCLLFYVICCVLRLARFNVSAKSNDVGVKIMTRGLLCVGVPAPAGAMLLLLPIYISLLPFVTQLFPNELVAAHMLFVGILMISQIPTYSFNTININRVNVGLSLIAIIILLSTPLIYLWAALTATSFGYLASIIWSWLSWRNRTRHNGSP